MKLTKKAGAVVLACVLTCITSVGVGYLWGSHAQEHAAVKDVADLPMYSWCSLSTLRDATDAGYGVEGSENQCYQPVVGTMEFQKNTIKSCCIRNISTKIRLSKLLIPCINPGLITSRKSYVYLPSNRKISPPGGIQAIKK